MEHPSHARCVHADSAPFVVEKGERDSPLSKQSNGTRGQVRPTTVHRNSTKGSHRGAFKSVLCRLCIISFWTFYIYNLFVWLSIHLEVEGNGRQPTPRFLPGALHGQRSLVGCSPWGCTESDTTERLNHHRCTLERVPRWRTRQRTRLPGSGEAPLGEGRAAHSSILALSTPWTRAWQATVHGVARTWT